MSNSTSVTNKVLTMTVLFANGQQKSQSLEDGASLILGQGANCGLQLVGDRISAMHCILRFQDGQLHVQDWCSESGTFVEGERIEDEVTVDPGVKLDIGNCVIQTKAEVESVTISAAGEHHNAVLSTEILTQEADAEPENDCDRSLEGNSSETDELGGGMPTEQQDETSETRETNALQVESARQEDDRDELPQNPGGYSDSSIANDNADEIAGPTTAWRRSTSSLPPTPTSAAEVDGGFTEETIELLQRELEYLQAELLERDNRVAEFQQVIDDQANPPMFAEQAETESLVQRLEDLIGELDRSDQRLRSLEELLLAEQEVSQAERDERTQLERWLSEIENRIAERESEGVSEREALTRRIRELKQQLAEREHQLCVAASGVSPEEIHENALREVRAENETLRQQLSKFKEKYKELETRIQTEQNATETEKQKAVIDETLREERMAIAQERAAMSRERAEIARKLAEEQELPKSNAGASAADDRFNAFRQTLRELHQEENRSPAIRKPSLGARIADLWKRLDGPTDTD